MKKKEPKPKSRLLKSLEVIMLSVIFSVISYAITAFIVWDYDPQNWTINDRGLCAILMLVLTIAIIIFTNPKKQTTNGIHGRR